MHSILLIYITRPDCAAYLVPLALPRSACPCPIPQAPLVNRAPTNTTNQSLTIQAGHICRNATCHPSYLHYSHQPMPPACCCPHPKHVKHVHTRFLLILLIGKPPWHASCLAGLFLALPLHPCMTLTQ